MRVLTDADLDVVAGGRSGNVGGGNPRGGNGNLWGETIAIGQTVSLNLVSATSLVVISGVRGLLVRITGAVFGGTTPTVVITG
jgi:hypothetical protein